MHQESASDRVFVSPLISMALRLRKIVLLFMSILLLGCSGVQQAIFVPSEIEEYCRRISASAADGQAMRTCVRLEQNAENQLSGMTVPPDVAIYCRRITDSTGGSYQVLLICVQQELSGL